MVVLYSQKIMIVLLTSEDDSKPVKTDNLTVYPRILLDHSVYNQQARISSIRNMLIQQENTRVPKENLVKPETDSHALVW